MQPEVRAIIDIRTLLRPTTKAYPGTSLDLRGVCFRSLSSAAAHI